MTEMLVRNISIILIFTILLTGQLSVGYASKQIYYKKADNTYFFVGGVSPNNYSSIQDAIDNTSDGNIVFVYSGIYNETIFIETSIKIIGENRTNTIIDAQAEDNAVSIDAENVIIQNFTITGAKSISKYDFFRAGIRVIKSNNTIIDNIIKDNRLGILGLRVTNLTIKNNSFIDDGITFSPYENDGRPHNKVEYFIHSIKNNTVNGKSLAYIFNKKDIIFSEEVGQIIAVNCTNITIRDLNVSHTDNGILMSYCSDCVVENCNCSYNDGVWIFNSNCNIFRFNNFSKNLIHGITIDYKSNKNLVTNNTFSNNHMMGVMIEYFSKKNKICYNNFIDNNKDSNLSQCFSMQAFRNRWDSNYWSDWIGLENQKLSFLPKIIRVAPIEKIPFAIMFNIDWHPAKLQYS